MIRTILIGIFVCGVTAWGANVDKDIIKTRQMITKKAQEIENLNQMLEKSSQQIKQHQEDIKKIDEKKGVLEKELVGLQTVKQQKIETINSLEGQKTQLQQSQQMTEKRLVKMIAEQLSFSMVFDKNELGDENDLLKQQIFKKVKAVSTAEITRLKQEYVTKQQSIMQLDQKVKEIKGSITVVTTKENELVKVQKAKEGAITKLDRDSKAYRAKLAKLIKEQEDARNALEQLNIVKKRQQRVAGSGTRKNVNFTSDLNASDDADSRTIKNYGNLYADSPTARYNGAKVDPPVDGAVVVKRFGPYTDPVYNIKIHNDYVVLRANGNDAIVKAVLDGRVVYAKTVASLGKVVILEHGGGLATIYAHLEKIAPTMDVGKRVSAGEVVGRVGSEVMFEVTKNGVPVNPVDLINVR